MELDDKIDAYLQGNLPKELHLAFEEEINQTPSLAKEVAERQALQMGIQDVARQTLLTQFEQWDKELSTTNSPELKPSSRKKTKLILITTLGLAASLLLVITLRFLLPTSNPEALFASYYKSYPNYVVNVERSNSKLNNLYTQSFHHYEQGNYTKAIEGFKQILTQTSEVEVAFYLSLSYVAIDSFEKALPLLVQTTKAPAHRFSEPAYWYAALTALRLDKKKEAKYWLEQLAKKSGSYSSKASQLLEKF